MMSRVSLNKLLERAPLSSAVRRQGDRPIRFLHTISLIAVVVVQVSGCASSRPTDQSIFAVLPGDWGWEEHEEVGCGNNSHAITFTKDKKIMLLKHKEASTTQDVPAEAVRYHVLQSIPNLRMAIEGEKRKAPTGEPVVWDLIMLSPDKYCWHRTDWPAGACTTAVVRCPVKSGTADWPSNKSLEQTRGR
jgi:hypothetical protein